MHETLVSDGLWRIIEPLLPPDPPREKGGRPRIPNRNAFAGIVYVLKSVFDSFQRSYEVGSRAALAENVQKLEQFRGVE